MNKTLLPAFALACLGLAATSCLDGQTTTGSSVSEEARSGEVLFRLGEEIVSKTSATSDSVRIVAVRSGFDSVVASGGLAGTTRLGGLAPGFWTLKVSLYDLGREIHWYGEGGVDVRGGVAVQTTVVLRPATGSVDVEVVLDSLKTSTVDTVEVALDSNVTMPYPRLPVDSVWRSADGVRVLTRYAYSIPVVTKMMTMSSHPNVWVLTGKPIQTSRKVDTLPHVVFVPYPGSSPEVAFLIDGGRQILPPVTR